MPGSEGLRGKLGNLYQRAREAGETAPQDAVQWAKQDVARAGDWEYRVLRLDLSRPEAELETELNALGADRWELFWIDPGDAEGALLILKRPAGSVLQKLPAAGLRMVPGLPGGGN